MTTENIIRLGLTTLIKIIIENVIQSDLVQLEQYNKILFVRTPPSHSYFLTFNILLLTKATPS